MDNLFIIQLNISFIVGGGIIAFLSFIAEKVEKRIAGIILTFPTTIMVSYFFLGWSLSPEVVAKIVPASLISLGLSVLFTAIYSYTAVYLAKVINSTVYQIITSYVISIGIWFILIIPVIIIRFNNLLIGIIVYVILALITHVLFKRRNYNKQIILSYTLAQKIGRAVFVGFTVFLVVLLSKTLNPFWGGMFAMFPAAFSSLMLIFHWYYGPQSLSSIMKNVAVGSLSLFIYAMTTMFVFPVYGFVFGSILAIAMSLIMTLLLVKFQSN